MRLGGAPIEDYAPDFWLISPDVDTDPDAATATATTSPPTQTSAPTSDGPVILVEEPSENAQSYRTTGAESAS